MRPMPDVSQLTRRVRDALLAQYPALAGPSPEVRYVVNRGGFVNASFTIGTPQPVAHVKVATQPDAVRNLQRWIGCAPLLHERYRAPRLLGTLDLGPGLCAMLFEFVKGTPAAAAAQDWVPAVGQTIAALHADADLAASLGTDLPVTCAQVWEGTYGDRYDADLADIRLAPPPFVSPSMMDCLTGWVARLRILVHEDAAFDVSAVAAIHGDLWPGNILIADDRVTILDWDDLSVGDPVMDWGMLIGYRTDGGFPVLPQSVDDTFDAASRRRFDVYRWCAVLDHCIDPLSDWIDAGSVPEHVGDAREYAERVHRVAFSRFQQLQPGRP